MRRSAVRGTLIALALVGACSKTDKAPSNQKVVEPPEETPPPPAIVVPAAKLALKTLTERQGTPYTVASAKSKAWGNLDRGNGISLGDDPPGSDSIAVVANVKRDTTPTVWALFGLDGKQRATFTALYQTVTSVNLSVVGVDHPENPNPRQGVMDLKTGKIVEPVLELPNTTAADVRIVIEQTAGTVWVFAKGQDGKAYHGVWKNPAEPKLALNTTLPFYPTMISTTRGIVVWTEEHRGGCGILALREGAAPICSPEEMSLGTVITGEELYGDRYWLGGDFAVQVVDSTTKAMSPAFPDCKGNTVVIATLPSSDRAVIGCADDAGSVTAMIWSPKGTWSGGTFKLNGGWTTFGPPLRAPVIAPEKALGAASAGNENPAYTQWLDVENATLYTTPPLAPPTFGGQSGSPKRFIATNPTAPKELWLVDTAGGFVERIATDIECKHELLVNHADNDRAVLSCNIWRTDEKPPASTTWNEIIDFTARKRTRVTDASISYVFPDGRAVGTTTAKPQRVALVTP